MYEVNIEIGASASNYWAVLTFEDANGKQHEKQITKERSASKNSNYIQSLIDAYAVLKRTCMVNVHTSSEYIVEPFRSGWIIGWEKNNWKNAKGNEVKNREQWQQLRKLMSNHSSRFLYSED